MATFSGASFAFTLTYDDAAAGRVTTNLKRMTTPAALAYTLGAALAVAFGGSQSASSHVVTVKTMTMGVKPDSVFGKTSGEPRYEQIHVQLTGAAWGHPNPRNLGSLLSSTPIVIEVWSAFRATTMTLQSIAITGPAGVTITDPYGTPIDYAPLQSRFYTAQISISGGPSINNSIVFDFLGISEPAAIFTGSRLVPFPFEPDWGDALTEAYEWRTVIITGDSGIEQRIQRRAYARKKMEFTPKTFTVQEAAYLESLIYGWIDQKYGVPAWHEQMRLAATASISQPVLTVSDGSDRDLRALQTVLIWQSPFNWEARQVLSFVGNTITLVDNLAATWPDKTSFVIPIWIGSLEDQLEIDRPARDAGEVRVSFLLEPRT